jgi:hypothetical protein
MRLLITRGRFWQCNELAAAILRRLVARYGPGITVIHGGATGVDEAFATACRGLGIKTEAHPVTDEDWKRLGKRAGPLRNARMIATGVDQCIAVHRYIMNSNVAPLLMLRPACGLDTFRVSSYGDAT